MSAAPALEAWGVRFGYRRGNEVLRGVDLALAAGEVALLWGLNGSGKTTLGKILAGLYRPAAGTVTRPRGGVGLVLASPEPLLLGATPFEDVRLGPALRKQPAAEIERRAREALALVGMWERRDVPCDELSLGEKKRVALAASFATSPAALVLDEPMAFLDDRQAAALAATVARAASEGAAVLVLSGRRDPGLACARALALEDGVVVPARAVSP